MPDVAPVTNATFPRNPTMTIQSRLFLFPLARLTRRFAVYLGHVDRAPCSRMLPSVVGRPGRRLEAGAKCLLVSGLISKLSLQ
jgi:hypothetical protein